MADYTVARIDEMDGPEYNGIKMRSGDSVGITTFGLNVGDIPGDADYPSHIDIEQEEVYIPVGGGGEIEIAGERRPLHPGTMARVGTGVVRKILPGSEGLRLLALGGIPGKPFDQADRQGSGKLTDEGTSTDDWTIKQIDEMQGALGGAFKRARAELGVTSFGMQVIDMPPDFAHYPEHADDVQEEVFVSLVGGGEIELDGERHPFPEHSIARVGLGVKRKIWPGPAGIRLLALGAIPGKPYEPGTASEIDGPDPGVDLPSEIFEPGD